MKPYQLKEVKPVVTTETKQAIHTLSTMPRELRALRGLPVNTGARAGCDFPFC